MQLYLSFDITSSKIKVRIAFFPCNTNWQFYNDDAFIRSLIMSVMHAAHHEEEQSLVVKKPRGTLLVHDNPLIVGENDSVFTKLSTEGTSFAC